MTSPKFPLQDSQKSHSTFSSLKLIFQNNLIFVSVPQVKWNVPYPHFKLAVSHIQQSRCKLHCKSSRLIEQQYL